jgi:MYXO-CTERM domain-containing protein
MPSSAAFRMVAVASAAAVISIATVVAKADKLVAVSPLGSLALSSDWATTALGQTPATVMGTGTNNAMLPVYVNDLTANGPSTYLFDNSFTRPTGSFADVQINDGSQGLENIGFIDSYVFAVPASTANAFAFSLNLRSTLGLDDLTARLYEYNVGGTQNFTIGGISTITNGLVDAWSKSDNPVGGSSVASTELPVSGLQAGEYVLEIAGLETGAASGSYSGQLNVSPTPVPLPGTLPLALGGIGLLLRHARRRTVA